MPFRKIKDGTKTIEIRLNDEKRRKLSVGDTIRFELLTNTDEVMTTEIMSLTPFSSFKELCAAYAPESYGSENKDAYESMYFYYTPEDEEKYGVLAIGIKVLTV